MHLMQQALQYSIPVASLNQKVEIVSYGHYLLNMHKLR